MNKEQLLELRGKIVNSAQELALNGQGSPEDRLQLLLNIIRGGEPTYDVLSKAYELTSQIDNDDGKLTALLDVLYEVDAKLGDLEQPGNEGQSQPQQQ
jgi:hypothetical protein